MATISRSRRGFSALLLIVMFALGACGAPTATAPAQPAAQATAGTEAVTLHVTVWTSNEAHLALLNQIAEAYKAQRPNVSVVYDTIPFADYTSKLAVQLAGSTPPDAGWIVERTAPAFIQAGVLADLAPVLKQQTNYNLSDFSAPAMQLWSRDNALYGVPFSNSPFFIIYNADLFAQAGVPTPKQQAEQGTWTWEALAQSAKAIVEKAPQGTYGFETVDGTGYTDQLWSTVIPIMRAYGTDAWNAAGTECELATPQGVQAMQLFHKMIFADKSVVPPGEKADFYAGQAAMTVGQISRIAKLKDATFKWDIAPLPAGPSGQPYVVGQAAFGAFSASKHPEAAADFVAFATNQANVESLAKFFPPARLSVIESGALAKANPAIDAASIEQTVVAGIEKGQVLSAHAEFPKIDLAGRAAFDALWKPDADVAAALTGVCEAITPLLNQ